MGPAAGLSPCEFVETRALPVSSPFLNGPGGPNFRLRFFKSHSYFNQRVIFTLRSIVRPRTALEIAKILEGLLRSLSSICLNIADRYMLL